MTSRMERLEERMELRREALAALKVAEEQFDQACALLNDVRLYKDGIKIQGWPAFSAEDVNMKFIPALIRRLERICEEGEDSE